MLDVKRHKDVFDPEKFDCSVHIIGCGGMGSRIAEGLARMGVGIKEKSPITLYDPDCFAPHNLTNQWADTQHIKELKVRAVRNQMLKINPSATVRISSERVDGNTHTLTGVVFLCLDLMSARQEIVDKLLANQWYIQCVIETRMDAGVGISHCFSPSDEKQLQCWRMYWYPDHEADNLQGCGGPQSIISAIYGTTTLALKQFEQFARTRSTVGMPNRVYQDFDSFVLKAESWPAA